MIRRRHWQRGPRLIAGALLVAWAIGLAWATVQLSTWREDVTQVLLQLRADDLLRSSVRDRDQVHPDWHRRRAVELLAAVERLQGNTGWKAFMPGAWRVFDDLEPRAAERIDAAFAQRVVETLRRELESRAADLSGARVHPASGEIIPAAGCRAAVPADARSRGANPRELPEYVAVLRMVDGSRELGRAMQALASLSQSQDARADELQMLIRYAFGADMPAPRHGSLARLHAQLPADTTEALARRIHWALHCGLDQRMTALHARWGDGAELLSLEDRIAQVHPADLFVPVSGAELPGAITRMREVAALLARQEALLARAPQDALHAPEGPLDPALESLLRQVHDIPLLGPEAAERQRAQAHALRSQWKQRIDAHLARPGAGLAWHTREQRLVPTPQRLALRRGVERLLREPFMTAEAGGGTQAVAISSPAPVLDDLTALAGNRTQFMREGLPLFPPALRPAVARFADERIAQLAFDQAGRFVAAGLQDFPADPGALAWSRIRTAEAVVSNAGAAALARRLRVRLEREMLQPILQATAPFGPAAGGMTQAMGAGPAPPGAFQGGLASPD